MLNTDNFSDVMDMEYMETRVPVLSAMSNASASEIIVPTKSDDVPDIVKADTEFARNNIIGLIEFGKEALQGSLELAKSSEKARDYEVFGSLMNQMIDANLKLLELQERRAKALKDVPVPENQTNIQNNINNTVYVGSTADLLTLVKQQTTIEGN